MLCERKHDIENRGLNAVQLWKLFQTSGLEGTILISAVLIWPLGQIKMHGGLLGVGVLAVIIGIILIVLDVSGEVSAETEFGHYGGSIGGVALILGIILMAIAVLMPLG